MAEAKKEKIILDVAYQPQVRADRDTRSIMLDVIIALIPAVAVAVWQHGLHPLMVILVSMASAMFFEWIYRKLMKKSNTIGDLSAAVTGLLLALVLPTTTPWWMPIVGTLFSIVIVKQLYGGLGKNFLNPALAGRAFLLASYATAMGTYAASKALDGMSSATPLTYLYGGKALPVFYDVKSLLVGTAPGCIGELSAIAILMGLAYLLIMGVITWRIPVSFVGTVAVLTLVFGKENYTNWNWMVYNVLSGGLLFGAVFMATDYTTSPVTPNGQLLFGVGCGALTVLIRQFGGYPEGVSYAILIMNLCAWAIDKLFHRNQFGVSKEDIAAAKAAKKAAKEAAK